MPEFEVRQDLCDAIKDKGQDVSNFVNRAVENALERKPKHTGRFTDQCCFLDEHCSN
jgi:hypothetical protein